MKLIAHHHHRISNNDDNDDDFVNFTERQQREKQAMLQRLQERLEQRMNKAAEAEAKDAQEQDILCEEQTQTIQKVLASNMDLTEE